jgi:hypothetical protein
VAEQLRRQRRGAGIGEQPIHVEVDVPLHVLILQRQAHEAAHVELPREPQVRELGIEHGGSILGAQAIGRVAQTHEQVSCGIPIDLRLPTALICRARVRVVDLLAAVQLHADVQAAARPKLAEHECALQVVRLPVPMLFAYAGAEAGERLHGPLEADERL